MGRLKSDTFIHRLGLRSSFTQRIEEIGYDKHERLYFVLDDNRLYRRTDSAPLSLPAPKPKANSKKGRAAARASKRRKTAEVEESADGDQDETWSMYADNGAEVASADRSGMSSYHLEPVRRLLRVYTEEQTRMRDFFTKELLQKCCQSS
jgi:hypothetical protein